MHSQERGKASKRDITVLSHSRAEEISMRREFLSYFKNCPIPNDEILSNLGLFLNRQTLSRIIFMHELYKKIIDIHGIIIEFGVRWGQNLSLFSSFRGMYEPFNYNRKIVGFDTFCGFPEVSDENGNSKIIRKGAYSVTEKYEEYLEYILNYHENENPISHIKKYELIKGDATIEIKKYLDKNPETIIALAYFDFDIYLPTKKCLEAIVGRGHLTKGSVIAFDELNCREFPGVTLALKEVLGLDKYKIKRDTLNPSTSCIIIE